MIRRNQQRANKLHNGTFEVKMKASNCATTQNPPVDFETVRRVCVSADDRLAPMFDAFAAINANIFGGRIAPTPMVIGIAPYGRCLAFNCGSRFILLNGSLWGGAYATGTYGRVCTLLHEMMHSAVGIIGQGSGTSSHDNDGWVAECSRIAPLIGLEGYAFGRRRSVRREGKPIKAQPPGVVPLEPMSRFPGSLIPEDVQLQDYAPEWAR
jgi:hypothetical protein